MKAPFCVNFDTKSMPGTVVAEFFAQTAQIGSKINIKKRL